MEVAILKSDFEKYREYFTGYEDSGDKVWVDYSEFLQIGHFRPSTYGQRGMVPPKSDAQRRAASGAPGSEILGVHEPSETYQRSNGEDVMTTEEETIAYEPTREVQAPEPEEVDRATESTSAGVVAAQTTGDSKILIVLAVAALVVLVFWVGGNN